jgi:FkbM family methyltransferase
MNHCFDISPIANNISLDPLSEILAGITKQLIAGTSGDFIDVGAYQGQLTDYVYNNCQDPSRNIIIFEPNKLAYASLMDKYKYIKRVQVNNLAIYSKKDNYVLHDYGSESMICTNSISYAIPVTTLDSLYGMDKRIIGLIKIRINGGESHALSGAHKLISSGNIQSIIFQIHPWQFTEYTDTAIIEKYLISLLSYYKYIYLINQMTLHIHKVCGALDIIELMSKINYCDVYDCACCSIELKFADKN